MKANVILSDEAVRVLALPLASLDETMQECPPENVHKLTEELDALAVRAALVSEYLAIRLGATGCGEKSHQDAMSASIRQYRKVRKAMGFSYPNAGIGSF